MIFLVRHAHAGSKRTWTGPDSQRPLSATGRSEAAGLVRQLRTQPVATILSSPAIRCQQSVQPLAVHRQLPVKLEPRLDVTGDVEEALALLVAPTKGAVLCTHGELIGQLLGLLRERGGPISPDAQWPKGSTWLLHLAAGQLTDATFLPPMRDGDKAP